MSSGPERPPRPSVPTTAYAFVACAAVEQAVLRTGGVRAWLVGLLAALIAAACVTRRVGALRALHHALLWVAVAAWCGLGAASVQVWVGGAFVRAMEASSVSAWTATVSEDPLEGTYGMRCRATMRRQGCAAGDVWLSGDFEAERGDTLHLVGRFVPSGTDEWGTISRCQGILGTVTVMRVRERGRPRGLAGALHILRDACVGVLDPSVSESRAVLAGFVLGDRRAAKELGVDRVFATAGIAHLMAVSGSHLAVVGTFVGALTMRLRLRPVTRGVLAALATGAFVCLCGTPASAVRAWLMLMAAQASVMAGRRKEALSALMLAALAMSLVEPCVTGQLGFRLSVACVASLTLFSPYASYVLGILVSWKAPRWVRGARVRRRMRHLAAVATETVSASIVAMVASAPLICPVYGRVSLVAPLTNLAAAPMVSACMALGLMACLALPVPWASRLLLRASDALLAPLLAFLRAASRLPHAAIALDLDPWHSTAVLVAGAVLLLAWWPTVSRAGMLAVATGSLALALGFAVRWTVFAPARLCVLDVGQGDAILVQDGTAAVLVDTGPDDSVAKALARMHVLRLDAVVLTHLHDDHYGGLDDLVGTVPCKRVLVATGVASKVEGELAAAIQALTGAPCEELGFGDELVVGGFSLRLVWPRVPVTGLTNPDSIELAVSFDDGTRSLTGLLTGDAEKNETAAVIEAGEVGPIDVLKVGHHGSAESLGASEARVLQPLVSVASAGEANEFGHPTQECVRVLEEAGSLFLCTKDVGDVQVLPAAEGVTVRCARPPS